MNLEPVTCVGHSTKELDEDCASQAAETVWMECPSDTWKSQIKEVKVPRHLPSLLDNSGPLGLADKEALA